MNTPAATRLERTVTPTTPNKKKWINDLLAAAFLTPYLTFFITFSIGADLLRTLCQLSQVDVDRQRFVRGIGQLYLCVS